MSNTLELFPLNKTFKTTNNNNNNNVNIDKYDKYFLKYNDFFWSYMFKNVPLLITSVSCNWLCQEWIHGTKVHFNYLKKNFGELRVPVANCSKIYFNSHEKIHMKLNDYLTYWEESKHNNVSEFLYLKDWHLKSMRPDYNFYEVPLYFRSDWLNEYLVGKDKDDYRFVYMGPKNTWTPFHSDVFSSFSWSTNIFGKKKWIILPPKEEIKLKNEFNNYPFSIDESMLINKNVTYFVVLQQENESFFVPSGWYHQVWNLTDTISINHNWFNSCNIIKIWNSMRECLKKVISEIEDCRTMDNFDDHCQTMLKAIFGMNCNDFFEIIEYIGRKRVRLLKTAHDFYTLDEYKVNRYHLLHDINTILHLLNCIQDDCHFLNNENLQIRCDNLKEIIKSLEIKI